MRKVVAAAAVSEERYFCVVCDDGAAFCLKKGEWVQIKPVPGTDADSKAIEQSVQPRRREG